jgi:alkanesulfonate monooxygenase SsuD/methylene tetrahydromethanopterin reductase-like flavin-dependent oxidoreductase (luciferase family)
MLDTGQSLDGLVAQAVSLRDAGIGTAWMSQIFGYDSLTALAVVGREVPGIELGTAVVPTYPRHPVMLAGQALTVQAASHGRLTLGIGLSHQLVIENVFGQSFEKPVRHMREYLSILVPVLEGEQVTFAGETLSA